MGVRIVSELDKAELEAVLASGIFARSPNLAKMLRYIGTKYLEGQEDTLKEYNIGIEALGRAPDFDPKVDSIVRVEAHRLREKLKRYYETQGIDRPVVISLQVGHYIPQFQHRRGTSGELTGESPSGGLSGLAHSATVEENSSAASQEAIRHPAALIGTARRDEAARWLGIGSRLVHQKFAFAVLAVGVTGIIFAAIKAMQSRQGLRTSSSSQPVAVSSPAFFVQGNPVRILCGYVKRDYLDRNGDTWGPDRYYQGGRAIVEPQVLIGRAADPNLFGTAREGEFSYDIPLERGTYELRLYFVETYYGPGTHAMGGETSRLFAIDLNGKRLLTDFDIYSDAGGTDIADVRVFKGISPAADGQLHLSFVKALDAPLLNALEIIPTPNGKIQPIRIVCQENSYTDASGRLWKPDRYFLRGRLATDPTLPQGSPDPGLYAEERYGNFSYAIPVAEGRYAARLFFDETYFGPDDPGKGGAGSRVFDVDCNGVALLRNFDIFQEAGGDNRPVIRTFHGLRPNAQGKLLLSFVPVKNYASVRAIEVVDESR